MYSSTSASSERRHSVPEIIFTKYKVHHSPDHHKNKIKTKNKSIQTDSKTIFITDSICSQNRQKAKQFKVINQNELINMILNTNHRKLIDKFNCKRLKRKTIRRKCRDKTDSESKLYLKIQKSMEDENLKVMEKSVNNFLSKCSQTVHKPLKSNADDKNLLLANIILNPSTPNVVYNNNNNTPSYNVSDYSVNPVSKNIEHINGDLRKREYSSNADQAEGNFLVYVNGDSASSDDFSSITHENYNTLTTRSSSNYSYCPSSHEYANTDRTVSTLETMSSSSSILDNIMMKNVATETDEIIYLPRSPKLYPLIIDTDSLLAEPLRSGYIPNAQMKLISVHFLDSDSENNTNKQNLGVTEYQQDLERPCEEQKENLVIYELEKENHIKSNEDFNKTIKTSFISENKSVNYDSQHTKQVDHFTKEQSTYRKINATYSDKKNSTQIEPCECGPTISNIASESYLDPTYPIVIPRLSAIPKTYSMLVNASSTNGDYSSDTSEISNPDSLDEFLTKDRVKYTKYDEKIVRGETSINVERTPKSKAAISFSPYFVTLNGDEIFNLPIVKYKLPEKIKIRIMDREKQLKKHNREICKYCSKTNLLKKLMRKKQQMKNLHKKYCKKGDKRDELSKVDCLRKYHENADEYTCNKCFVADEVDRNIPLKEDKKDMCFCEKHKNKEREKDNHANIKTQLYHYHTQRIKNEYTQTSTSGDDHTCKIYQSNFTQTSVEEKNKININFKQIQAGINCDQSQNLKEFEREKVSSTTVRKSSLPRKVSIAKNVSKKKKIESYPKRKDCYNHIQIKQNQQMNESTQTDANKSTQYDLDLKSADEDVDNTIMKILLEGLIENEKNAEKESKKSKDIHFSNCEMEKCPIHHDVEKRNNVKKGFLNGAKFTERFEAIPEEGPVSMNEQCFIPVNYRDKTKLNPSVIKEPCVCSEEKEIDMSEQLKKEVIKYKDYLMNKKKNSFCPDVPPAQHEVIQESVETMFENRRHSVYGHASLDVRSKTNCRRHTVHGNSTILNYKRAMMVGAFTPFVEQQEGSKGKQALIGEQEEPLTLSKGWINFYLLRGPDSQEFFSDPDDECLYAQNFDMSGSYLNEKEEPSDSFSVRINSKPDTVLPTITNTPYNKPAVEKKTSKLNSTLPKLNLKPNNQMTKLAVKKDTSKKKETKDFHKINTNNRKSKTNPNIDVINRKIKSPKSKTKEYQVNSKKGEKVVETSGIAEQNNLVVPNESETRETLPLEILRDVDTPVDSYVSSPHIEDTDHMDYENSIRTISSVSVRSESDNGQNHIVKQPHKTSSLYSHQDKQPFSEKNWTITVDGKNKNNNKKQSTPNLELYLSMNESSEHNRDHSSCNRQSNKMSFSLTLKNSFGDSEMTSDRQDSYHGRNKKKIETNGIHSSRPFRKLTQIMEPHSARSSPVLSFHEPEDMCMNDDSISSKRDENEGLLSVTGNLIMPEKRTKPPTMSEKDMSLYKNSKRKETD